MARTDTLNHFLTDVADAIRTKTGSAAAITASSFDTEITNIPTSGGDPTDYFNGDFKNSAKTGQAFFRSDYIQPTAQLVDIDCTGKTNLNMMFSDCGWHNIPKLKNTSSVTDMSGLYQACANVTTIDTSQWDTSHVKKFANLFYGCSSLTNVDLSNITTESITGSAGESFYQLFQGCSSLTSINISHWVLPSTGTLGRMPSVGALFTNCNALTSLTAPATAFKSSGPWGSMFQNCTNLPQQDIVNFVSKINNPQDCTSLRSTFSGCELLESITLDISNANSLNTYQECYQTFNNCRSLKSVNLTLNGSSQFQECFMGTAAWGSQRGTATTPETFNVSIKAMNNNAISGTMSKMFYGSCAYNGQQGTNNGTDIVLNIDFNNAIWNQTYFENMFVYCGAKVINLKNFNITTNSTSSFQIFGSVSSVEEIHVTNCDFSGPKNFSNFITESIGSLKIVDLAGMTVSSAITNFNNFCTQCSLLELLDVRNFTFSNATSWNYMLTQVPTTCVIVVKDATEKTWFNTNYPTYTNVMTAVEYEAQ